MEMKNVMCHIAMIAFLLALGACSEDEEVKGRGYKEISLSIPVRVEAGEMTKSIDDQGFAEGYYPLDLIYLWVQKGTEWESLGLSYTSGESLRLDMVEEDGMVTLTGINSSITFDPGSSIYFSSQPQEIFTLVPSGESSPGGSYAVFNTSDDVLFRSASFYVYDSASGDIISSNGGTSVTSGLNLTRCSSVIQVNVVFTSLGSYEEEVTTEWGETVTTRTYTLAEADWLSIMGTPYTSYSGRTYIQNFPYLYNLRTMSATSWNSVVSLARNYQTFAARQMQEAQSVLGGQLIERFRGFGGGTNYSFLFAVGSVIAGSSNHMTVNITIRKEDGSRITAKVSPISILSPNVTYIVNIVFDINDLASQLRGTGEVEITPARIYVNGEMVGSE